MKANVLFGEFIVKTLIELYDERPIENVLGAEMFRPEKVIFLCPQNVAQSAKEQKIITDYFLHRSINSSVEFMESSMFYTSKVRKQLEHISDLYEDCALDITGGTDAALFAGGLVCAETNMPVFTYSRKRNRFFSINNADFADNLVCDIQYRVEDFFKMTGGVMRQGRVDNSVLSSYMDFIDLFFDFFMKYRRDWKKLVSYIQHASSTSPPTFSCLAFLSVITPLEVEMIAIPKPLSTLGSSSEPLYCLKPGLEAL